MSDKSQFYGIDPNETRAASRRMDGGASSLKSVIGDISSLLEQVQWTGPGSQRFVGEWNGSLRPELNAAADHLHENAVEMERRAQMQEEASA